MVSVNMDSFGIWGKEKGRELDPPLTEFRGEGWLEAGRRQHMYVHTHHFSWVLCSHSVTFRDTSMQELDVRTEKQNNEGCWERLRHAVNPCALWMLSRSVTTFLKVNVSCQKIQGLGWVSSDVLYLPSKGQGHLVHLNKGTWL